MGTFWVRINQFFFTNKLMKQLENLYLNHIDGGNELKGYIKSLISNRLENPNDKELKLKEEELRNFIHFDYDISADISFQLNCGYADGTISFDDVNAAIDGIKEANDKFWDMEEVDRDSRIDLETYDLSCGELNVEEDFDISVDIYSLNKKGASQLLLNREALKNKNNIIEKNKNRIEILNNEITKLVKEVVELKGDY